MEPLRPDNDVVDLSDRALQRRRKDERREIAKLNAAPVNAEVVEKIGTLVDSVNATESEIARRNRRAVIDNAPRRRALREREERRRPNPASQAIQIMRLSPPPEIADMALSTKNLNHDEGRELLELTKERKSGSISEVGLERWEVLVGRLAGDRELFANKRRQAEVEKKMAQTKEQQRLDVLPKRPVYAETGSVTVPRFVFDWLRDSRDGEWQVGDTGMLVTVLAMFENRTSLFMNSEFSDEDGEPVLTVRGGLADLRLLPGRNGNAVDSTGSGFVRERAALRTLVRNKWLEAEESGMQLRIKLGERARTVREGKEPKPQAA